MPKNWITKEYVQPDESLIKTAGSELLAKLLVQRGINTPEKIKTFLNPEIRFKPPFCWIKKCINPSPTSGSMKKIEFKY